MMRVVIVLGSLALVLSLSVGFVLTGSERGRTLLADHFPLRRLAVSGRFVHVTASAVRDRIAPLTRGGFFLSDIGRLRRAVLEDPWVSEVVIRRRWPDTLEFRIRERRAIARWSGGGLVDEQGRPFRPAGFDEKALARLPSVAMPLHDGRIDVALLRRLRNRLAPLGQRIDSLVLDRRRALRLRLAGGPELRLGSEDREVRLARFVRFRDRLRARLGDAIGVVDLRYDNGLAVARPRRDKG